MTTITGGANGTLVQYKLADKHYNSASAEASATADPFDEVRLAAGETFELPEGATLIAQRELGGAAGQGGTPQDFHPDANAPDAVPSGNAPQQGGTPD